jgi:hypothetical protein
MEDDKLGIKPEVLVAIYASIDVRTRKLAPEEVRNELRISQDGRIKNRFYVQVSNRMAPHLIAAIQEQAESRDFIGMKSYLYSLQEQVMAQMFAGVKDVIS